MKQRTMRATGALVLLVCVVYVNSQACPPACPATECCLKPNGARDPGRCSPLLPRNARCRAHDIQQNGGYLYDCPCADGLTCRRRRCMEPEVLRAPPREVPTPPNTTTTDF